MRLLLATFLVSCVVHAKQLDSLCQDSAVFELSQRQFHRKYGEDLGFRWLSSEKRSARAASRKLTLFQVPVAEVVVRFADHSVSEIWIWIHTRGDKGSVPLDTFQKLNRAIRADLGKISDANERELHVNDGIPKTSYLWEGKRVVYRLDIGATAYATNKGTIILPEYSRLRLFPATDGVTGSRYGRSDRSAKSSTLRKRVKTSENGDVVIEGIPMVHQGRKGYCACAAVSRILMHLGRDVDQHEIAQIAGARSNGGGTEPNELLLALREVESDLNLDIESYARLTRPELVALVKSYNAVASKQRERRIRVNVADRRVKAEAAYRRFRGDILLEATDNKFRHDGFARKVRDSIERGIPLAWSVYLGIFPEKGLPQVNGWHMRLITGYNERTQEILYSDSWGLGHEKKRMSLKKARAMTVGLFRVSTR